MFRLGATLGQGRRTYNARSETVADKLSSRGAWRQRQLGICLLDSFYEPNWENGRAVKWRVQRADREPMGVACLWDDWICPATGEVVTSFSMLTVNADGHPVMGRFHRPGDEKRSVVVLPANAFEPWLKGGFDASNWLRSPATQGWQAAPVAPFRSDAGPHAAQQTLFA
jgi:putative SOS response-associated peptidase YedK